MKNIQIQAFESSQCAGDQPFERENFSICQNKGKLLVYGGISKGQFLNDLIEIDMLSNQINQVEITGKKTPFVPPGLCSYSSWISGNYMYVYGG